MGYRIQYDPKMNRKFQARASHTTRKGWSAAIILILAFVLVVGFVGMDGGSKLKSWLLPGDAEVTEAALSEMMDNIRAGESFSDAVTAFCMEIIENAQIQ